MADSPGGAAALKQTAAFGFRYHISVWGTNVDIALSNPPDTTVDALAARAAAFYQLAGRQLRYRIRRIQRPRFRLLPVCRWRRRQVVVGCVGLPDQAARTHLAAYRDAGVVAFLFGGGAGGVSCAYDAQKDGVTNPAAIRGNTLASELAAAGTAPIQVLRGSTPTLVTPYAADDGGGAT